MLKLGEHAATLAILDELGTDNHHSEHSEAFEQRDSISNPLPSARGGYLTGSHYELRVSHAFLN